MHTTAEVLVYAIAAVALLGVAAAALAGLDARLGRVSGLVGLASLAAGAGFLGSIFQQYAVGVGGGSASPVLDGSGAAPSEVGGFAVPVGATVAVLALAAVLVGGLKLFRSPIGVLIPAAGWLAVVGVFLTGGGKDDIILANDGRAQFFLYAGLLTAAAIAVWGQQVQLRDRIEAGSQPR